MSKSTERVRRRRPSASRQRGVATLLILLLVGLAVVVTALAVAYSLRSNQQRQLATHSVTTAQASAWRGVEFLRDALAKMADTGDGKQVLYGLSYGHPPVGGCIPVGESAGCGGGFDEAADWSSASAWKPGTTALSGPVPLTVDSGLGFDAYLLNVTRKSSFHAYEVTAKVIGRAAGSATEPLATATLEVVYAIGSNLSSSTGTCASLPPALMVFNGDLHITGGSLGVTDGTVTDYENIAVAGNITMESASQARVSGCAKKNIDVSGGGVTANGYLHAEGDIRVHGSSPPAGTTLWGRNVTLDGSASRARYAEIKAGAYAVALMDDGKVLGSAKVAGKIIPATAGGGIPWTTGTVVLGAGAHKFEVTLADGSVYLVDPKGLTVDPSTGRVSGAASSSELLSGDGKMPDGFTLQAGSIFGGTFTAEGLTVDGENGNDAQKTGLLWAHGITLGLGNQGFGIVDLRANGDLRAGRGAVRTLEGGGSLWSGTRYSTNNYGNHIKATSGTIAGDFRLSDGGLPPVGEFVSGLNIVTRVPDASPGLPGLPYCDARVNSIDADTYKVQANYIFEFVNGVPTLTVRNVKDADGASIDGSYNLLTMDLRTMPAGTGAPFLVCNWQSADNENAHCFRDATPAAGWSVTGLVNFPVGVAWFDGDLTVDGTDSGRDLINTIIGTGKVTLTQAGHGDLVAPNFSTPARVCDGAFWPTNLCDKRDGVSRFVTWTDRVVKDGKEEDVTRVGAPIANMAIVTEGSAQLSGWKIYGSIILGRGLGTAANVALVQGTLTVGANQAGSPTKIDQGGAQISVPTSSDQMYLPVCESVPAISVPGARVQWSRYL